MKKYDYIFFDFDGTLSDSAPGIVNSVVCALERMGTPVGDRAALKKYVDVIFFAVKSRGALRAQVLGEQTTHQYNLPVKAGGESRCTPGRGIRENYLAFGLTNPDGQDFQLDRIEARLGASGTRRTQ